MADNVIVRVPEQQIIKGEDGKDGASAYEQAVAGGYTGTEAQFNEELRSFKALSEQAADSAAAAAQSESNAAGSATTATTKAQEAADSAAQALIRMNSAAASAQAAAETATTFTEQTVPAAVNTINEAKADAISAVGNAQTTAVGAVQQESTTQQAAIQQKGEDVLDSIPADYTTLSEDVDDLKSNLYAEESSPNLLYLNTVKPNYYISNTNGQEVAYNNWGATDYIPVVGGETYAFIGCYSTSGTYEYIRTDYYAFYDKNKEYISGGFNSRGTITAPDNAKYIRESSNLPAFTSAMYATMFGLNSDLGSFVGQKTKADYIEPSSELVPSEFLTDTVKNVIGKTITVEKDGTGDYTTLKDAVEYSASHEDTTILVGSGTYDLITEFGASYFADMTTSNQRQGLQIGNGVHIIFSSGAKVTAHYTGSNDAVKTCFSPFNFIQGSKGFTLENLTIEASNVRYCVHDEAGNTRTPNHYKNVYKNCKMQIDNSQNSAWSHHQCIGGGLGLHGEIIIDDSVFTDLYNINYRVPAVSYHNALGDGAKSRIVVKGCWFSANATVRVSWYGTSTEITEAIIHDNSCTVAPYVNAENESSVVENVTLYSWNNEIRT